MILVLGTLADSVMGCIVSLLIAREADFLLVDPRHYSECLDLVWTLEDGKMTGSLRYGKREVAITDIHAVYVHQIDVPTTSDPDASDEIEAAGREIFWTLAAFTETLPALVINRPSSCLSNLSKPYQQQILARYGFYTPRTLITTQPEEVHRFYEECHGRVIFKSISHRRSIVRQMVPENLKRLEYVRNCVTQFQEYIAGNDVRVHVVGDQLFATEIVSDAVDYRYAGMDGKERAMRSIELPDEIAERCLQVTAGAGMVMSGIDLRRTPEGKYYCFEFNPTPGFTFYQAVTGQHIGQALVNLLCQRDWQMR